ncbi:MAG: glycosyltransferase family 4 protein [Clostridiaceae bacterium]|nr:glycosyltransferase family 4 protein [Clostridiaceae bacterium]
MKKKDILFLCQYFFPEYVSSAVLPFDTAEALRTSGFSVGVLCGYPKEYNNVGKLPKKEVYKGIEITRVKYLQLSRRYILGRLINYFSFTFLVALRFGYLRKYRSIIVYSNPPILPILAYLACKIFSIKLVFVCYDVYPEMAFITNTISKNGIISKVMKFINRKVFKCATKVVALSHDMKSYLVQSRPQLTEHQIQVIPNWYQDIQITDIERSYLNPLFSSLNPRENFIVSYFGNMGICQDLDTILNAIRKLKNEKKIKFIFAGHGSKMALLNSVVKDENLNNVVIYNFLHGQDFQDALNISDCCLVSLKNGLVGLAVPSKTYSYMMAGKPIISIMDKKSDISQELINNDAGYAIEINDVCGLVQVIKELRDNDVKRDYMGHNSRKVFLNRYTKEKCTQHYVNMMRGILEG